MFPALRRPVGAFARSRALSALRIWIAFKQVGPFAFLAVLPVALFGLAVVSILHTNAGLGPDFQHELYPEAKLVLHGRNPFPPPDADLSAGTNRIWPILAAVLVAPLTALPSHTATVVFCALLLVALGGALWLLGVTDWRLYGIVALWPSSFNAVQSGNLTIPLLLLVVAAWRFRERRLLPGVAIGLAIALKLFLWPLGIWLLARRQFASTAVAAALALGGTLLVLPFTTLTAYEQLMRNLANTFGPKSYNIVGLLTQSGVAGTSTASLVADGVGLALIVVAYRRQSLPIAIAASLILSPIVWMHYYILLVIPLFLSRPRLTAAWALPLVCWWFPLDGSGVVAWNTLVVLAVLATVTTLSETGRRTSSTFRATAVRPSSVARRSGGASRATDVAELG